MAIPSENPMTSTLSTDGSPAVTRSSAPVSPPATGSDDRLGHRAALDLVRAAVRQSHHRLSCLVIGAADIIGLVLALELAHGVRLLSGGHFTPEQYHALWPLPVLLVVFLSLSRCYAPIPPHPAEELRRLSIAVTSAFLMLVVGIFFLRSAETFSRLAVAGSWVLALLLIPLMRAFVRGMFARKAWWGAPVIICGAGLTGSQIIAAFQGRPSQGLRPVLLLDDDPRKIGTQVHGIPVAGPIMEVGPQCAAAGVHHLLLAMPGATAERLRSVWSHLGALFPVVMAIPGTTGVASIWVEAKDLGGHLALELNQSLLRRSRRLLKRLLDIILILAGSVVVIPAILGVALLVRCSSRGPVFYGQQRVGRGGTPFLIWKFRTMRSDADEVLARMLAQDEALRQEWERDHKLRQDPRVTVIGRILRRTSLDELPQFWNVLVGQMSLVGPRPVTAVEAARYGDYWDLYLRVRPGLTGLWQVSRDSRTTYQERVMMDSFYVHNWSPWLDLVIIGRTVRSIVRGEGAC